MVAIVVGGVINIILMLTQFLDDFGRLTRLAPTLIIGGSAAKSRRCASPLMDLPGSTCLRTSAFAQRQRSIERQLASRATARKGSVPPVRHHDKLTPAPLPASVDAAVF